ADVVHKQLGGGKKRAATRSGAFGQALVKQATAEGGQQSSPQLTGAAATTAAGLGNQLGRELAARYAKDFPSS
ncbi:MAG: hypothetical protein J2P44_11945, partial [Candidatus Dormibacteraeota bacterium]|nr:hypothetical protein [Candidatus Dormibacteraeota bacterium]